jgi:L-iditol 2-dehydrogenase
MKQAVMTKPGKIEFCEVDVPTLSPGQVLIKLRRIGVCGSDIHVYHGKHPFTPYPVVQGHEVSGEIIEVAGVKGFKIGDKVTVQPQVSCGQCYPCKHSDYHICDHLKVMGFQTTGMASEYFAVDAQKVLKLPDSMSFDDGALVEPLAVACHALGRSTLDLRGKSVIVMGAGPIGNLTSQAAKAKGAAKVMITDISPFRLELAKKCGIDYAVNTLQKDLKDAIAEEFGADKADLILDCAGNQATVYNAVNNARKGSEIIVVAVIPDEVKINLSIVQDRELKLIGTLMYKEQDYLQAIEMLSSGKIKTELLITDYFDFEAYDEAYQLIEERKDHAMKVMIKITKD